MIDTNERVKININTKKRRPNFGCLKLLRHTDLDRLIFIDPPGLIVIE